MSDLTNLVNTHICPKGIAAKKQEFADAYTQALESLNVSTEKEKARSEGYIRSEFLDIALQKTEIVSQLELSFSNRYPPV